MRSKQIKRKKKRPAYGQLVLHIIFMLLCLCYVYPLLLLITASFEGADYPQFSLRIQQFSTLAYEHIFSSPRRIINAYCVTIFYSVVGTVTHLIVVAMFAYPLSKRDFKYRNIITFLLFFTTLFNGGLVPNYLVNAKLLLLNNTIWIYIIPGMMSAWNVIVIRTFYQGLPEGLCEAARIDGASEFRICVQIILPLATPALASIGFLHFIGQWNNWYTTSIYIKEPELYSLQYLLKQYLDSEAALKEMMAQGVISGMEADKQIKNMESLRFAMAVVAAGPALIVFPFFQKYFSKGLTMGSVKG